MKSANEMFKSIMNNEETNTEENNESDINIEINVIQKENEIEEEVNEINEQEREVDNDISVKENIEENIKEAEMLINILRTEGINQLSLNIISTNKLYTDIWKLRLPSVESLDTVGMNRYQAEQLANALEGFLDKAKSGLKKVGRHLFESANKLIKKQENRIEQKRNRSLTIIEKIENLVKHDDSLRKLLKPDIDDENKEYQFYSLSSIDNIIKIIKKFISNGKSFGPNLNFSNKQELNKVFNPEKSNFNATDIVRDILQGRRCKFFEKAESISLNANDLISQYEKMNDSNGDVFINNTRIILNGIVLIWNNYISMASVALRLIHYGK